jgi:CubicO group peptidase (beta-lactamase class C family)
MIGSCLQEVLIMRHAKNASENQRSGSAAIASRLWILVVVAMSLCLNPAYASTAMQQYDQTNQAIVDRGTQALVTCNGLFVSNRTLEQIYDQELKLDGIPIQPQSMVAVDRKRRTVAVGGAENDPIPTMRAVDREGLGCIIMAPSQTFADLDDLPELRMSSPAGDPASKPWPQGDQVPDEPLPGGVDEQVLEAAADFTFNRAAHGHPSHVTVSLLIVYEGDILLERYAPGFNATTRTRTWSVAKSIANTLIGIAVDQGKLALDEPLPVNWAPQDGESAMMHDPRRKITLRNVLHMSSGLFPVDNDRCNTIGSCLSYFAGANSVEGAVTRGLVQEPGMRWDYENYDTILGIAALKGTLKGRKEYLEFPRRMLFDRLGMHNTTPGVDRFGNYVMSSQVYTTARDLARLGLLYLNNGIWNGERVLSESWVKFVRTPAPSTKTRGNFYGGQWWLPPDERTDVPQDAHEMAGHRGQYVIVVPSCDLVIVRRGLDTGAGEQEFPSWDLLKKVVEALPDRPPGKKL